MRISRKQNEVLLNHGIDYTVFDEIDSLLDVLDDKILEHLVNQDCLNKEGIELQKIFDEMFYNN